MFQAGVRFQRSRARGLIVVVSPLPRRLLLIAAMQVACGGGPAGPAAPTAPAAPEPIAPTTDQIVGPTPSFVVRNAAGFESGATYDFVVLGAGTETVVEQVTGVPAGDGQTTATLSQPLSPGFIYRWKAVAHGNGRDVESAVVRFEVGIGCDPTTDPWAKSVAALTLTQCSEHRNRPFLLDPRNVLGPPDARGNSEGNYANFLSLGEGGVVIVDMGACVADREGMDLRVYQYIESEPVRVQVGPSPSGPWYDLGTQPCGDGGLADTRSNHCDFDLATAGVHAARFVWVEDAERFPCEYAGTRTEGADIDAVEILHLR